MACSSMMLEAVIIKSWKNSSDASKEFRAEVEANEVGCFKNC